MVMSKGDMVVFYTKYDGGPREHFYVVLLEDVE